jgi:predicted small secreted protein
MKTTIQRLGILFFSLLLLAVSSLGCKTAEGFGKDMENAGEGIQKGVK